MKNQESILIKNVELTQSGEICYSGGALNSYDKMTELAMQSLGNTEELRFIVCAVDNSLVPLYIQKIGNGIEKQCMFSMKDAMKFAVASSSYGLIIAHNNVFAGNYCNEDDFAIINYVQAKGLMIGVHLIDYIILDRYGTDINLWFLSDNLTNFAEWNYKQMNGIIN